MFDYSRFTEIFVNELESTADLRTLVVDYLQGLPPNAAIVDGIVRFVMFHFWINQWLLVKHIDKMGVFARFYVVLVYSFKW